MYLPLHRSPSDGPDYSLEEVLIKQGHTVCGCDEAGRGPLAGPVTAAAVVLNKHKIPDGLHDSKKLTAKKREKLFDLIMADHQVAFASLNATTIDRMNIRAASLHAMAMAVHALAIVPTHSLIDGNAIPDALQGSATPVVKGDARCLSIAAASIIAKVMRDRQMIFAGRVYPQFGFEGHKGYPSQKHRTLLKNVEPCPLHRKTFAPVRDALLAKRRET